MNENINKIGQNLKFDLGVLLAHGYKIKGKLIDTMIAHYLIDPPNVIIWIILQKLNLITHQFH